MFLAEFDSPIRLRLFFAGFEKGFMGLACGKSKCYGSNISAVYNFHFSRFNIHTYNDTHSPV